mgnify:CR=1 FL=1
MTDNVEANVEEQGQEAVLFTFTNDKSPENMGVLQGLLKMVYHTVLTNRLGIMQAKNSETGEPEVILVGVEQNGDSLSCYPLFSPIRAEDVAKYVAPDGKGEWLENKQAE